MVVVPLALVMAGGDGDEEQPAGLGDSAPSQLDPQASGDTGQGIAINAPEGWKVGQEAGVVTLSSSEGAVQVSLTAVTTPRDAGQALADATAAIRSNYDDVTTIESGTGALAGKRVGGLPATSAALSARGQGGTELRVLVSAARGDAYTYLVEVFSAANAPATSLTEAQLALETLRLTG